MTTDQTVTDQPLPLDVGSEALLELDALRAEVPKLRAIAAAAVYDHGHQECLDKECDCPEYVDDDGKPRPGLEGCPNVEERHATAVDLFVRERLEYLVGEVLDRLDDPPEDGETATTVRAMVREEINRCGMYTLEVLDEDDPRGELERPPLYDRIHTAYEEEVAASLAAFNQSTTPQGAPSCLPSNSP